MENLTRDEMQTLHDEFVSDITVNEYNLYEVSLKVHAIKAKWMRQLWTHDHELKVCETKLGKLRKDQSILIRNHLKVDAKESEIKKLKLQFDENIEKLEGRLEELEFIVKYLKMYEASVRFFGNDVDHAIQATKMEH